MMRTDLKSQTMGDHGTESQRVSDLLTQTFISQTAEPPGKSRI